MQTQTASAQHKTVLVQNGLFSDNIQHYQPWQHWHS